VTLPHVEYAPQGPRAQIRDFHRPRPAPLAHILLNQSSKANVLKDPRANILPILVKRMTLVLQHVLWAIIVQPAQTTSCLAGQETIVTRWDCLHLNYARKDATEVARIILRPNVMVRARQDIIATKGPLSQYRDCVLQDTIARLEHRSHLTALRTSSASKVPLFLRTAPQGQQAEAEPQI
jgi:hypothetical protein